MNYICSKCKKELDVIIGKSVVYISPCLHCLEEEYRDGRSSGGWETGRDFEKDGCDTVTDFEEREYDDLEDDIRPF